jgi:hypothetical protein
VPLLQHRTIEFNLFQTPPAPWMWLPVGTESND